MEEFGREWIQVYLWLSPFAVFLETVTTVLTGYNSVIREKGSLKETDTCLSSL